MLTKPIMLILALVATREVPHSRVEAPRVTMEHLFAAVSDVESGGNWRAFKRDEDAAGIVQIRPCLVADCNRIVGHRRWRLQDRWDRRQSEEMFKTDLSHYGRAYRRETGREATAETYARMWQGGPAGWRKASTLKYWSKVRARL